MDKIPFSLYDFFGYLASGVLLMASIDYFYVEQKLICYAGHNVAQGVVSILLIYIIGHIISTPAFWIYESFLAKKILGHPRENLLKSSSKGWRKIFPDYYRVFPKGVKEQILNKFKDLTKGGLDENEYVAIYQIIFGTVKTDELALGRLNVYLTLYGFTRNISFTSFTLFIILIASSIMTDDWKNIYCMIGFLLASLILLFRYLKFYWYYVYDMYLSFLSLADKKTTGK